MEVKSSTRSRVPQHLQHFHGSAVLADNSKTNPLYPATLPLGDVYSAAHDRAAFQGGHSTYEKGSGLRPRRSLRVKFKNILLKDWPNAPSRVYTRRTPPKTRPTMMRMKDSDDYLTARAANPRTGVISPSIGNVTPRPSSTPATPGEALELMIGGTKLPPSPTPGLKLRPALRRANEGRKLSQGSKHKWQAEAVGWLTKCGSTIASPRISRIDADATESRSTPVLGSDKFAIHMPTANEPQPYAYPGYTSKQIEAFEHYKAKTTRVSSEGYDQRVLSAAFQACPGADCAVSGVTDSSLDLQNGVAADDGGPYAQIPHTTIHVGKGTSKEANLPYSTGIELDATTIAPFASPRTPSLHVNERNPRALKTMSEDTATHLIHRKPIGTNQHYEYSPHQNTPPPQPHYPEDFPLLAKLQAFPQISLGHPSQASFPQTHHKRPHLTPHSPRKCSLGCPQQIAKTEDGEAAQCLSSTSLSRPTPLFPITTAAQHQHHPRHIPLLDLLLTLLIRTFDITKTLASHLPPLPRLHSHALAVLNSETTTPAEKFQALKTLVLSTVQFLLMLGMVGLAWQVGSWAVRVVEVLLWPLGMPLRILRWGLVGGG